MIKNIIIIFISIFFEALPFLFLGSLISAVIDRYVSEETFVKLIPKNKFLAAVVGVLLGFFIPACDCAVIPIARRLLKKKVPLNVILSFMLSSPIINPVVLFATYTAFSKNLNFFYLRLILGIVVSLIVSIIMAIIYKDKNPMIEDTEETNHDHDHNHDHHNHCCSCHIDHEENDLKMILKHTIEDMFDVLKHLIVGALIASLMQNLIPASLFSNQFISTISLMIFAYLMSLCSTSDSFVAKSMMGSFNDKAILAYLLLGPMIDIKNTIVLMSGFKKKFVFTLIFLIFITIFVVVSVVKI